MPYFIAFLGIAFFVGLFTRSRGDGFLDTISSGLWTILALVAISLFLGWLGAR